MTALPFYLVIDTSASLMGDIGEIDQQLAELLDFLKSNPVTADKTWVSLIQFSSNAEEVVRLSKVDNIEGFPSLRAGGATNYGAAFSLVRRLIARDVAELRSIGERIYRPVMFFLTDGSPIDVAWREDLRELQASRERPTIIAIGFGSVDPGILREVSSQNAFMISESADSGVMVISSIFSFAKTLLGSTIQSTVSNAAGLSVSVPTEWIDLSSSDEW